MQISTKFTLTTMLVKLMRDSRLSDELAENIVRVSAGYPKIFAAIWPLNVFLGFKERVYLDRLYKTRATETR